MSTTTPVDTWLETHRNLCAEADAFRDSQAVAFGLLAAYDKLSPNDRNEIHQLLANWLVSDDNKLRYDAAFLVNERKIQDLASAIRASIDRAKQLPGPEPKFEVEKLTRILEEIDLKSRPKQCSGCCSQCEPA